VVFRLTKSSAAAPVLLALLALLGLWQGGAWLFAAPSYILPRPFDIAAAISDDALLLGEALRVTLTEAALGFLVGASIGIGIAAVMALAPPLEASALPIVVAINSVPAVAFTPLALIWFGLGMASKIAMAALAVSFPVLLNALAGLKRPEIDAINLLRSFGAGPLGILWRLRLPAAAPFLVTGLRIGLARSMIAVIVAEMLGAYAGLGQIIYQSTAQVDYLTVWAAVFIASLGSFALYGLLVAIDRKLVWWR
jgi:ABC-type nitrate/sulfonate/bicarbonate transport system permease component